MGIDRMGYQGCLLGLAAGDAMGYTVDNRSWPEIQRDYGPHGLLGYDLVNGYADVTSYTQLAAFTCNGLLFGLTRGQTLGKMAPFIQYIAMSSREWMLSQRPWGRSNPGHCWLGRKEELCRRHCLDTRLLDTLGRQRLGTLETPVNRSDAPTAITTAVAVGLFFHQERLTQEEIDRLGAEAVALTQGDPMAFLPGAVVAHVMSRLTQEPEAPLKGVFQEGVEALKNQFGPQYRRAVGEIAALCSRAMAMAQERTKMSCDVMELLGCRSGAQVLAGAMYACLISDGDFDRAMAAAVNHSGRSAAVGALTGAILGLRLGRQALPEFYMECLEPAHILTELADDMFSGCPMIRGSKLFDLDWDYKYRGGGT